ncbi:conserved hypothetical protein [Altererythrobacter sp. B11]|uniref:Rossmann fold domain-containing protein n=1 Tax=Altererythrobacter sp. B11 TaxID=2060312 RepID=UPI000DC72D6A|nr:hypothetical protein [Altererythrobacter sp. B11]BBC72278.1 conserved hypothetical protein [Altererythrobacter sp. B11]
MQAVLRVDGLPPAPLDAAAAFHAAFLPQARTALAGADALVLVFPAGDKADCGWRLAAVQALAREAAPKRANGVAGDSADAVAEAVEWLADAPGITGQLLAVDGNPA